CYCQPAAPPPHPPSFPTRRSSDLKFLAAARIVDAAPVGVVVHQLDGVEIAGDGGLGLLACRIDQPHHQEETHHGGHEVGEGDLPDRKSTRLNSSHVKISYAVFCLK